MELLLFGEAWIGCDVNSRTCKFVNFISLSIVVVNPVRANDVFFIRNVCTLSCRGVPVAGTTGQCAQRARHYVERRERVAIAGSLPESSPEEGHTVPFVTAEAVARRLAFVIEENRYASH